jgi:FkbM family methyltransferase
MPITSRLSIAANILLNLGYRKALIHLAGHARQWRSQHQFSWARRRIKKHGSGIYHILGNRMQLDTRERGIDVDLALYRIREPAATGYFMALLKPEDIVLEAGANIGYYTLLCAQRCRMVYAIEPHPYNLERLGRNVQLNQLSNIELFLCAVGSKEQRVEFYCSTSSNCHSCIAPSGDKSNVIEVDEVQIDTLMSDRELPTILRMDIEGYEYQALSGAAKVLRHVRAVFLELHCAKMDADAITSTLELLTNAGLKPTVLVQFDHPGISVIHGPEKIHDILAGEHSTFEIFFERNN